MLKTIYPKVQNKPIKTDPLSLKCSLHDSLKSVKLSVKVGEKKIPTAIFITI